MCILETLLAAECGMIRRAKVGCSEEALVLIRERDGRALNQTGEWEWRRGEGLKRL